MKWAAVRKEQLVTDLAWNLLDRPVIDQQTSR
jgi:hypothetical protein